MDLWHWFQHFAGADDPSGHWYTFWSGFGADVGEIALLGAAVGVYRKHNCHVHRCWRIAKQEVLGTSWKVCHHHHPMGRPTEADIATHVEAWRVAHAPVAPDQPAAPDHPADSEDPAEGETRDS